MGLLPTAIGIGGTSVVWGPMASTIIFGLIFSTLTALVIIPMLYGLLFDKKGKPGPDSGPDSSRDSSTDSGPAKRPPSARSAVSGRKAVNTAVLTVIAGAVLAAAPASVGKQSYLHAAEHAEDGTSETVSGYPLMYSVSEDDYGSLLSAEIDGGAVRNFIRAWSDTPMQQESRRFSVFAQDLRAILEKSNPAVEQLQSALAVQDA